MDISHIIELIIFNGLCSAWAYYIGKKKGYDTTLSAIAGFVFNIFAIIVLYIRDSDEYEPSELENIAGGIGSIAFLGVIIFGFIYFINNWNNIWSSYSSNILIWVIWIIILLVLSTLALGLVVVITIIIVDYLTPPKNTSSLNTTDVTVERKDPENSNAAAVLFIIIIAISIILSISVPTIFLSENKSSTTDSSIAATVNPNNSNNKQTLISQGYTIYNADIAYKWLDPSSIDETPCMSAYKECRYGFIDLVSFKKCPKVTVSLDFYDSSGNIVDNSIRTINKSVNYLNPNRLYFTTENLSGTEMQIKSISCTVA